MKSSFLLAVAVFAMACTDATSPDPHSKLAPRSVLPDLGHLPPPPVDAAIEITVFSTPVTGFFTGTYFANASVIESVAAAFAAGDEALAFSGTAWLRLDNSQSC